jgi:hypothetical protein
MSDIPSQASSPVSQSYRPALLIGFLVCFLWLVLVFNGVFDRLELPLEIEIVVGFFFPTLVTVAILHRSSLFRESRRSVRVIRLFLYGVALLISALALLTAAVLFLFAVGAISPN